MTRISKRTIEELAQGSPGTVLRDTDLKGFQARRNRSNISYAYEFRAGSGRSAPVRRVTIGRVGNLTPDEARQIAKGLASDVAKGNDPAATKGRSKEVPVFRVFAVRYLDEMAAVATSHPEQAWLRPGTIRNYRSLLNQHLEPALGNRRLDKIGRDEVARLHKVVGARMPSTANRCLELIGSLYRAAAEGGLVAEGTNPAKGLKAYKEVRRERYLSPMELTRLGEAIRAAETEGIPYEMPTVKPGKKAKHVPKSRQPYRIDPFTAAAFRLLIFSGARLREILHAKWTDLDLNRVLLTIYGKTGRRHIVLPAAAVAVIEGLDRVGEYVISSAHPQKPKADLARPWKSIRQRAGLTGLRIHDLRHSFASVAVSGGASLPMIGKLLGHSQPQTTARYAHLSDDPLRAAAEKAAHQIERFLSGA